MPKSLDGIKKLKSEDLQKSRQIILDFIGEKKAGGKVGDESLAPIRGGGAKKLDGITINKSKIKENAKSIQQDRAEKEEQAAREDWQKRIKAEEEKKEQERLDKIKKEEERLKIKEALTKQEAERKKIIEQEKQYKEQQDQEKERRRQAEQDKIKAEKLKIAEEKKLLKEALLIERRAEKEKRKLARAKKIKKYRKNIKIKLSAFLNLSRIFCKRTAAVLAYLLVLLLAFYIALSFIIIGFKIDNKLTRKIADYITIPALITNYGIVDYYDYQDKLAAAARQNYQTVSAADAAVKIKQQACQWAINNLIYQKLVAKYRLELAASASGNKYNLAKQVILDDEINQVSLARVQKIEDLLKASKDFSEVKKFGDGFGERVYLKRNLAESKFSQAINSLPIGQISSKIVTASGFYIIEKYSESGDVIAVKYIFVKAKTLDDYLTEKQNNLKVFSLVD